VLGHGRGVDEDMLGESAQMLYVRRVFERGVELEILTWVPGRPCWRL
jgi:hypothetical protein